MTNITYVVGFHQEGGTHVRLADSVDTAMRRILPTEKHEEVVARHESLNLSSPDIAGSLNDFIRYVVRKLAEDFELGCDYVTITEHDTASDLRDTERRQFWISGFDPAFEIQAGLYAVSEQQLDIKTALGLVLEGVESRIDAGCQYLGKQTIEERRADLIADFRRYEDFFNSSTKVTPTVGSPEDNLKQIPARAKALFIQKARFAWPERF